MYQVCIDDVQMQNYTQLASTVQVTTTVVATLDVEILPYQCEPFDCNGNGVCDRGTCVCYGGLYISHVLFKPFLIGYAVATPHQGAPGQMIWLKSFRPGFGEFVLGEVRS